jgi:hypothetical protein
MAAVVNAARMLTAALLNISVGRIRHTCVYCESCDA